MSERQRIQAAHNAVLEARDQLAKAHNLLAAAGWSQFEDAFRAYSECRRIAKVIEENAAQSWPTVLS